VRTKCHRLRNVGREISMHAWGFLNMWYVHSNTPSSSP